jgi:hypothetical protein
MWMSASSFSVVFRKVAGGFGLGGFEPLHTGCEVFHYGNDLAYLAVVGFDAFGEVFEGHWSLSFEFNPKCLRAVARRALGMLCLDRNVPLFAPVEMSLSSVQEIPFPPIRDVGFSACGGFCQGRTRFHACAAGKP